MRTAWLKGSGFIRSSRCMWRTFLMVAPETKLISDPLVFRSARLASFRSPSAVSHTLKTTSLRKATCQNRRSSQPDICAAPDERNREATTATGPKPDPGGGRKRRSCTKNGEVPRMVMVMRAESMSRTEPTQSYRKRRECRATRSCFSYLLNWPQRNVGPTEKRT